jgi:hypothetical protein
MYGRRKEAKLLSTGGGRKYIPGYVAADFMSHIKRGASIVVPDSLSVDAGMPLEAARRQIRLSLALIFGNYSGSQE